MLTTHNPDQNGRPSTGLPAPQRARASWTGIFQLSLLAVHVLHDPALVRPAATLEADLRDGAASAEELNLACTLIDSVRGPLD
jgi:non-homologous end joining protein Ku